MLQNVWTKKYKTMNVRINKSQNLIESAFPQENYKKTKQHRFNKQKKRKKQKQKINYKNKTKL